MYLGEIVETGPRDRIFEAPAHPYTRSLLASIPGHRPCRRASAAPSWRARSPRPMRCPRAAPSAPAVRWRMTAAAAEVPRMRPVGDGPERRLPPARHRAGRGGAAMTTIRAPQATYRGRATGRGLAFTRHSLCPAADRPAAIPPADGAGPRRRRRRHRPRPGTAADRQGPRADWMVARGPQLFGEDCLNLELWTPAADTRPAGRSSCMCSAAAFRAASASGGHIDEAGFAAANEVVLVRPNMRTGALGFLHLAGHFEGLDVDQPRHAGSGRRAGLGARQHRQLRWRPRPRDAGRPVLGRLHRRGAVRCTAPRRGCFTAPG